jgi:hypothetical protein
MKGDAMNWIITRLLKWAGGKFVGHRTIIGGVGFILLGIINLINLIWPDTIPGMPPMDLDGVLALFAGGFTALGIGGKLEKNIVAVKEQTDAIKSSGTTGSDAYDGTAP